MTRENSLASLEAKLNDFAPAARAEALSALVSLARQGQVPMDSLSTVANMHSHTFFSYNAYGCSPTGLAWLAKRRGIKLMGIVDFDVLDGVDEFLNACELVEVRGSAGMETRVYLPEFAAREINSPGEPGVYYHMGIGFTSSAVPESAAPILADLRARATRRNRDVMQRVNQYLSPVEIDYERDVLPLTPAGTATERHMILAYLRAVERETADAAGFIAEKLDLPKEQVQKLASDVSSTRNSAENSLAASPQLQNLMRSKLMKRGGVGYVEPTQDTFPTLQEVNQLITACGALPCATWLDGTSPGEQNIDELFALLIDGGIAALNIIPDRNWNIPDPESRRIKIQKLYEIVRIAADLDLPLNIGTEMNSFGLKWVDDFDAPELAPVRQAFLDGAFFIYGHTVFQRHLRLGYQSEWAKAHLPGRRDRNQFYTRLGYLFPPGRPGIDRLAGIDPALPPEVILSELSERINEHVR